MMEEKQLADLKPEDLKRHVLWEFSQVDDMVAPEATIVHPFRGDRIPKGSTHTICRATFTLADGTTFPGHVQPCPGFDDVPSVGHPPSVTQPTLFAGGRAFAFWQGYIRIESIGPLLERFYRAVSRPREKVWPLAWRTDVLVEGETEPRRGVVHGFYVLQGPSEAEVVRETT